MAAVLILVSPSWRCQKKKARKECGQCWSSDCSTALTRSITTKVHHSLWQGAQFLHTFYIFKPVPCLNPVDSSPDRDFPNASITVVQDAPASAPAVEEEPPERSFRHAWLKSLGFTHEWHEFVTALSKSDSTLCSIVRAISLVNRQFPIYPWLNRQTA